MRRPAIPDIDKYHKVVLACSALLLITDDVIVYKLTGGQPSIHEHEESKTPLGPFQGSGEALFPW